MPMRTNIFWMIWHQLEYVHLLRCRSSFLKLSFNKIKWAYEPGWARLWRNNTHSHILDLNIKCLFSTFSTCPLRIGRGLFLAVTQGLMLAEKPYLECCQLPGPKQKCSGKSHGQLNAQKWPPSLLLTTHWLELVDWPHSTTKGPESARNLDFRGTTGWTSTEEQVL